MKVLEIRGQQSYYAAQAFHKLMLGLKMLPAYCGEHYEEFYARMDKMTPEQQETMIREAAVFVRLEPEEFYDLIKFAADDNGVPYGPNNTKALKPEEIHEIITAVSFEIAKNHRVRLLSETEKKN